MSETREIKIIRKHLFWVLLMVVLTSFTYTVWSGRDTDKSSGDLEHVKIMAAKGMNPGLYATDYFLGDESPYRDLNKYYIPFYLWMVKSLWRLTGEFETGLAALVPLLVTSYLLGMILLLTRFTKQIWVAVSVALVSTAYRGTMGAEYWGVGDSYFFAALTIFAAFAPWLFYLIFRWLEERTYRLAVVTGLAIGLMANLHPASSMNVAVLACALFLLASGSSLRHLGRHLGQLATLATSALVGALPVVFHLAAHSGGSAETVSFASFSSVVNLTPFFPREIPLFSIFTVKSPLLDYFAWIYLAAVTVLTIFFLAKKSWVIERVRFVWLIGGLTVLFYASMVALASDRTLFLFLVAGSYIVYRFWRGSIKTEDWWTLGLMALVVLFSYVSGYVLTKIWEKFELVPLSSFVVEQRRTARFIYLPIFFLNVLAGSAWISELQGLLPRILSGEKRRIESTLGVFFGLLFASGAGLSYYLLTPNSWNVLRVKPMGFALNLLGLAVIILAGAAVLLAFKGLPDRWKRGTAIVALGVICFSPLGQSISQHSPVPLPIYPCPKLPNRTKLSEHRGLFHWVDQNTRPDDLFYWCGMPDRNALYFRANAQRGVTHCRRDDIWVFYSRPLLRVEFKEYYDRVVNAGKDPKTAVSMAEKLHADFVLTRSIWHKLELPICFRDENYTVYAVNRNRPAQ